MRSAFDKFISWTGLGAGRRPARGRRSALLGQHLHRQPGPRPAGHAGHHHARGRGLADLPQADAGRPRAYAGSTLDTGPEAKAYADHYILVHMNAASDGRTYSEVSGEYIQLSTRRRPSQEGQALGQLRQTLFMGNTLRGLLLYGYAFATMGTIAGIAAIVSFAGGGLLLVLVGLGLWHARRAEQTAERPVTEPTFQPV